MSEAPSSRDGLLACLGELARAGVPDPDRLRAAREAMLAGHLGPPGEACVADLEGRPVPVLVWAATWGDREMVELLLERGAPIDAGHGAGGTALQAAVSLSDLPLTQLLLERGASPLATRDTRDSVLREAHAHHTGGGGGREIFYAIRSGARSAAEQSPQRRVGLAVAPHPHRYALRTERGARDLRGATAATQRLDVLLVGAEVKDTARALGELVQAHRREADVAARPVADARRLAFAFKIRGLAWTIVPLVVEAQSPWAVDRITELAARDDLIATFARTLAGAANTQVVHLKYDELTAYSTDGGIDTRTGEPDDWWTPSGPLPSPDEAAALLPTYAGDPAGLPEAAARRRERLRQLDAVLAEMGVFVPPMTIQTDGYHVQLELFGVDPADVERADVVVLQEFGEAAVDRTLGGPAMVPSRVVESALDAPDQPALVAPPPPAAAPGPAEPPPMVREPPPMVSVAGPAPSEAPPMVHEPPPMVAGAVPAPSGPPPDDPPPPSSIDAAAPAEPPRAEGTPKAAPPMVKRPPEPPSD